MESCVIGHAFAADASEEDRIHLLIHLSRPCARCLEGLEELAREPLPSVVVDDPVALALRRWLELLQNLPGLEARVARLRPAHIWWIRHFRGRPMGFARLVIEESRQIGLERPDLARRVSRAVDETLHDPRLAAEVAAADVPRRTLYDLQGLARIYHGDACRAAGDLGKARFLFTVGESEIDRGTHDDEIRATLCELSFLMAWIHHRQDYADQLLAWAEGILSRSRTRVPGRLAETWFLQGWSALQTDPRSALRHFRRVLGELPDKTSPALRYLALHWSAAASHLAGKDRSARRFLREAREVELPYSMPVQEAQDHWLRGRLELASKRWRLSEAALGEALELFRRLGRTFDALSVSTDLFELCLLRGRPQDLEGLAVELRSLLDSPEAKLMTCLELKPVIEIAKSLGLSTPSLSKLYVELLFESTPDELIWRDRPLRSARERSPSGTTP